MEFTQTTFKVSELVQAFSGGSLVRNPEYQRGAAWSLQQKQALIDSLFRRYPVPPMFLELKQMSGLGGKTNELYEIIDGQQRILSLTEYLADNFALLSPSDTKLRLPLSLRSTEAPWGGKRYSALPEELRKHLNEHTIDIYLVADVQNTDEIRDLFIRLQSGTALTRQQIRDAWPGALGPRIEQWAGKLKKQPKYQFFTAVDGRGTRDDEDDTNDAYLKHRTTCAQLCTLLLKRAQNPFAAPSIKAADLDGLYHEYTQVTPGNNLFDDIENAFSEVEDVVSRIAMKRNGRRKVSKITLFALAMFLQDVHRSPEFKLTTETKHKLASSTSEPNIQQNSRASSGGVIKDYYERWRDSLPPGIGLILDHERGFSPSDKKIIRENGEFGPGKCAICKEEVFPEDEEYDHFPIPYRDGGPTKPDNGRLVHKECHPRGRPELDD